MAKKMSSDFLNFLRFGVTESAAATYTEQEVDTNLSAERGVIMNIHSIEFELPDLITLREVAAGASEQIAVQVLRESKTGVVFLNDSDVIARAVAEISRSATIGTDAGPLYFKTDTIVRVDFPLPIPYVKPSIFVGIIGTVATATRVRGRIGYTLQDISRSEFLELLVALQ